jgi:hypothetical protein
MAGEDEIRGNSVYETEQLPETLPPVEEKPIAAQLEKKPGLMAKCVFSVFGGLPMGRTIPLTSIS